MTTLAFVLAVLGAVSNCVSINIEIKVPSQPEPTQLAPAEIDR